MAQPIKRNVSCNLTTKKKRNTNKRKFIRRKKYGTSKLEEKFASNFLDKLGVEYIYQFEAKSIGRYYDFYLPESNILIEVDGDYYHSFGVDSEDMTPMQKRNKRVDKAKDHWALMNGIPILRIWEHDINKNPKGVMKLLKEKLTLSKDKKLIMESKKLRNFGK